MATSVNCGFGGEKDGYDGSVSCFARVAGQFDSAAVFGDDAAADPESESGAAFPLGGEEGLEEVRLNLFRNADAIVCDHHRGSCFLLVAFG